MFLAVIPARGGSKGIPGKNIKEINGKPLIAWSIEAAKESRILDEFLVSTDDERIAEVASRYDCPVLMRPPELATDEAKTISVLEHIIKAKETAEHVVVLQPTSPLRHKGLIDDCLSDYTKGGYDNLATGFYCKFREFGSHNNERRQDYKGFFYDDGNVYVLNRSLIGKGRWSGDHICFKEISKEQNFEIDDSIDFLILDTLMKNNLEFQ
ncbi:MAG: acylneuraminate cytidylyltransferase family protein [Desulfamplus sp.]|nr:acylneuraminate cytidylyltransferase family protein [Desulfamplus sp.]